MLRLARQDKTPRSYDQEMANPKQSFHPIFPTRHYIGGDSCDFFNPHNSFQEYHGGTECYPVPILWELMVATIATGVTQAFGRLRTQNGDAKISTVVA